MKKIIALALAASMLSTSAFAAVSYYDKDNKKVAEPTPVRNDNGAYVTNLNGLTLKVQTSDFYPVKPDGTPNAGASSLNSIGNYQFTADNFTVTYKVKKGASLVQKPTLDGEGNLVIKFNPRTVENGKIEMNVPDVVFEYVQVKAKRAIKDIEGKEVLKNGSTFRLNLEDVGLNTENNSFIIVQNEKKATEIVDAESFVLTENTENVQIKKDGSTKADFEEYLGNVQINGRVYAGDVVTFKTNTNPKAEVLTALFQANPDADLDTHTFVVDGFRAPLTVKLTVDALGDVEAKDQVLYFMDETGKLTACNWKYNADEGVFEGKLPTGTTTVVNATKALTASPVASSNEDKKPADSKKPAVPETGLVVNVDAAIVK